jgi:hypothetical protein
MVLGCVNAAATGASENHRAAEAAPGAVAQAGGVIHHLVDGRIDKSGELDFGDRAQVLRSEPDGNPGDGRFGEWGVSYPVGPEALEQSDGRPKHAAIGCNIFAQHQDTVVLGHRLCQCEVDRFDHCHLSHGLSPPQWQDHAGA